MKSSAGVLRGPLCLSSVPCQCVPLLCSLIGLPPLPPLPPHPHRPSQERGNPQRTPFTLVVLGKGQASCYVASINKWAANWQLPGPIERVFPVQAEGQLAGVKRPNLYC